MEKIDLSSDKTIADLFQQFKQIPFTTRVLNKKRSGFHSESYIFDNFKGKFFELVLVAEKDKNQTQTPSKFKALHTKIYIDKQRNTEMINAYIKFASVLAFYGFDSEKVTFEDINPFKYLGFFNQKIPNFNQFEFKNGAFKKI